MLQRIRNLKESEGGFTLIELLIVIVILGILAAIVVFSVLGITSRGVLAACKADVKSVQVASEAYYSQYGTYATTQAQLTITGGNSAGFLQSWPSSSSYSVVLGGGGPTTPNTVTVNQTGGSGTGTFPTNPDPCTTAGLK